MQQEVVCICLLLTTTRRNYKLLICNGSDSEVFTINNKKEFGELQKYFLDTLNIDITEGYLFWKPPYDIAKIIVNKMNKFMKF